jgi:hypothetical protein
VAIGTERPELFAARSSIFPYAPVARCLAAHALAAIGPRLPQPYVLDDVTVPLPPVLPSVANLVVAQQDQEWELLV